MRQRSNLSYVFAAVSVGVACNAVLGLEKLEEQPPGGNGAEAGMGDTGGTSTGGRGGSSGSAQGGRGGSSGSGGASSGTAGEGGAGMGGGGDCEPDDVAPCSTADPSLLGNCRDGEVVCQEDGTWGDCSVTPEDADSCDEAGDDADCDGTENGMCPCIENDTRDCGPDTEEGICQRGTQTCVNEAWGDCEGAVFPEERDCLSAADNDCDGEVDNTRDDECPCAVEGTHVCVEDAPLDWEGPMAIATVSATASSPSCTGTGYERQVVTKFGAIDGGSATCDCDCGTPAHSCGSPQMHRGGESCLQMQTVVGPIEYPNMSPGTCFNLAGSGGQNFYPFSNYTAGACTPNATVAITRARFTERVTGCETNAGSPAGCAAQSQCVPELVNPLEAFCIYRDGDHACPNGPYSARAQYFDTVDDTRSCSSCSCATSTGQCSGSVTFVRQPCPGQIAIDSMPYGGCGAIDNQGFAYAANPSTATPMGSCQPAASSVQGAVSTTGPVTLCCKP